MQKGSAKTLANPLQERKRQDSNLRTALGRSTVFEAASFSHSDTLPVILLGLCPKLSQFPRPPFQGGDQGLRAFHRRLPSLLANSGPASDDALLLTLRAAFASSTYLLSQIPGPGRSSDDDLLNLKFPRPPFQGGTSSLRAHQSSGPSLRCSSAGIR